MELKVKIKYVYIALAIASFMDLHYGNNWISWLVYVMAMGPIMVMILSSFFGSLLGFKIDKVSEGVFDKPKVNTWSIVGNIGIVIGLMWAMYNNDRIFMAIMVFLYGTSYLWIVKYTYKLRKALWMKNNKC